MRGAPSCPEKPTGSDRRLPRCLARGRNWGRRGWGRRHPGDGFGEGAGGSEEPAGRRRLGMCLLSLIVHIVHPYSSSAEKM